MAVTRNFISIVIVFFLLYLPAEACKQSIIKTQKDFDDAVERINRGEETKMCFTKGTFVLKNKIHAKAPLTIKGHGATIKCYRKSFLPENAIKVTNTHNVYALEQAIGPYALFLDSQGDNVPVSETVELESGVNMVEKEIVSDGGMSAGSSIKIPISSNTEHLKSRIFNGAFGYLDCGWQIVKFLVEKSDKEYFYCKTLEKCRTENYSYDKKAYKRAVRYVIYNAELKADAIYYDERNLYIPKSVGTVYYVDSYEKVTTPSITISSDFSIRSVNIVGFNGLLVNSKASEQCVIEDCSFRGCLGYALKIERNQANNVLLASVRDCRFVETSLVWGCVVELTNPIDNNNYFSMTECEVSRYPNEIIQYKNPSGGIWVDANAILKGNVIYNTPRCHIYCGHGRILVLENILYNTDGFNDKELRNLSNDLGLIYCNHVFNDTKAALDNEMQHRVLLENNLLYGAYAYGGDARGIFIDNGRGDVICKNNIILNTQLYSIDARNSFQDAASVRNRYEGNIVTTRYRLAAGESVKGDDKPVIRRNHVFSGDLNVVLNIKEEEIDVVTNVVTNCRENKGNLLVDANLYKEIRKSPAWKSMRKYVKKIN